MRRINSLVVSVVLVFMLPFGVFAETNVIKETDVTKELSDIKKQLSDITKYLDSIKSNTSDINKTTTEIKIDTSDINKTTVEIKADTNNTLTAVKTGNKKNKKGLWNSTFDVGLQILPEYNEDGENQGFNQSRMFANINFDARWTEKNDSTGSVLNVGVDLKLLGTASNDSNESISTATSFNDVSDTFDLSVYYQVVPNLDNFRMGASRDVFSEIGFIAHFGARSRKEKSINGDTVDTYADVGLKYSFFRENPYIDNKGMANQLPDFYIGGYYRYYSDYNGLNRNRYIVDFKYQILSDYNFLIGSEANLGKEESELYLTLTFRNDIGKIFSFFSIDKN